MMSTTKTFGWALGALSVVGVSAVVLAQGAKPPVIATDITAAEVQSVINYPTGGGDRLMKAVDMGTYNVGVGVLRRGPTKPGAPVGAIMHQQITEVYYVVSGSGTLLTGGTVTNAAQAAADSGIVRVAGGPSAQGTVKVPAQRRKVSAGDIVIIPPGAYHGFDEVTDHVEYVAVRPDPEHVLPAGWVHPAIKK